MCYGAPRFRWRRRGQPIGNIDFTARLVASTHRQVAQYVLCLDGVSQRRALVLTTRTSPPFRLSFVCSLIKRPGGPQSRRFLLRASCVLPTNPQSNTIVHLKHFPLGFLSVWIFPAPHGGTFDLIERVVADLQRRLSRHRGRPQERAQKGDARRGSAGVYKNSPLSLLMWRRR